MLPFGARVDPGAKAMKGCSAFPKTTASLEPHHQIVGHLLGGGGVLPLCRVSETVKQRWQQLYSFPTDWRSPYLCAVMYIHVNVSIFVYVCDTISSSVSGCTFLSAIMHMHVSVYMYVAFMYMYVGSNVSVYMWDDIGSVYVCLHICMYVCI